jgi:hypothetical protein
LSRFTDLHVTSVVGRFGRLKLARAGLAWHRGQSNEVLERAGMNRWTRLLALGLGCFAIGALPILAFTFFSPGIHSEGPWGYAVVGFGVATLICLSFAAAKYPWVWGVVILQALLIALLLYQEFSDSALYVGT